MNKQLCERIVQTFDYKTMEVLKDYIQSRIDVIHNRLERESDPDIFRRQQGMIEELRTLSKIREYAVLTINVKE